MCEAVQSSRRHMDRSVPIGGVAIGERMVSYRHTEFIGAVNSSTADAIKPRRASEGKAALFRIVNRQYNIDDSIKAHPLQ